MSFSEWLIIGAIFILILTIAFGFGWWLRNNSNPTPAPPNAFSAPLVWGTPTPGPNPTKNFCQLYQFPTALVDIDGIETAIPGNPTFNANILNNLQGVPNYPQCLDSDQIMAQQLQHACTAPNGVINGAITRCFLIDGGLTGLGGTESYYTNSGCFNVPACAGQLSLVSINFQAPTVPNINCIQNEGTGFNVTMQSCDPSNNSQLFRITRIDPGQNPNSLQPGQGQNGLIAQILDRDTGLCLIPGTTTTTTIYDPDYLGTSQCMGPNVIFSGTNVTMGECTGGIFPGYVWVLLPSLPYCPLTGGCGGCTGCPGCNRVSGSTVCFGCAGCNGDAPLPTPPQIVYVGNLNLEDLPVGPTGYNGFTGPSAIVQWLIDNNAQSLYYGGTGNGLILRDLGTDVTVCEDKPFISQYLNITTYNTIIQEEVCLQEITTNPNCIPL